MQARLQTTWQWFQHASRGIQIGVAVGALVLVCGCCGTLTAALAQGGGATTTPPVAQATNTAAATKATPTHGPTATPKATATREQQYTNTVKSHTGDDQVTVSYDASSDYLTIVDNIGEQIDAGSAVLIFRGHDKAIFQDIYTHAAHKPATITIKTLGPTQDQYGNTNPNGEYAVATLDQSTAKLFNWENLTQDAAWQDYDVHLETAAITNG